MVLRAFSQRGRASVSAGDSSAWAAGKPKGEGLVPHLNEQGLPGGGGGLLVFEVQALSRAKAKPRTSQRDGAGRYQHRLLPACAQLRDISGQGGKPVGAWRAGLLIDQLG